MVLSAALVNQIDKVKAVDERLYKPNEKEPSGDVMTSEACFTEREDPL
jgi:hypothetical protein